MANTFVTQAEVASMIVPALHRNLVLSRTVTPWMASEYGGGTGDTVPVKLAARRAAQSRPVGSTAAVTVNDSAQRSVDVVLTDDVHDPQDVTDASFTLDIADFTREVLQPSAEAVARRLEDVLITTMSGATFPASNQITLALGASAYDSVVAARRALSSQEIPMNPNDLWLACGTDFYHRLLEERLIAGVDQSGTEDALRNAMVGRLSQFNIVESVGLPEDKAYAYHSTAFIQPVVAPVVPQGVNFGGTVQQDGMSLQYIRDYDPDNYSDRLSLRAFSGAAVVLDPPKTNPAGTPALYRAAEITVAAV